MAGLTQADVDLITLLVDQRIAATEQRVATAISESLKQMLSRIPRALDVGFATVIAVNETTVDIQLDVDATTISSYSLGTLTVADRVAVLFIPPSASLVLGKLNLTAVTVP